MSEVNKKHVEEVFSDKAFVELLLEKETPEEVQAALKEKNIEISEQEILTIRDRLNSGNSDELSLNELEDVSGGIAITLLVALICGGISLLAAGAKETHQGTKGRW